MCADGIDSGLGFGVISGMEVVNLVLVVLFQLQFFLSYRSENCFTESIDCSTGVHVKNMGSLLIA
uniref:Uncharacterized protein n=1 Tax=Nelumbo nucifera TaxID=4432 RepID=A0A822YSF3_NELNU|nr:TPA_asm: hypothetical protein HUJ06_006097 [Nelumbo nucifera]